MKTLERAVAVLFVRGDSVYRSFSGCEVFDVVRDARTFDGSLPVKHDPRFSADRVGGQSGGARSTGGRG